MALNLCIVAVLLALSFATTEGYQPASRCYLSGYPNITMMARYDGFYFHMTPDGYTDIQVVKWYINVCTYVPGAPYCWGAYENTTVCAATVGMTNTLQLGALYNQTILPYPDKTTEGVSFRYGSAFTSANYPPSMQSTYSAINVKCDSTAGQGVIDDIQWFRYPGDNLVTSVTISMRSMHACRA